MLYWKHQEEKTRKAEKEISSPRRMRTGRTEVFALEALMINCAEKEVKNIADIRQKGLEEDGWNKCIFCRELS